MNVLVACEESQAVCLAFRRLGHKAFSCDLQECSGGHPEYHFKGDMFDVIANRGGTLENGTKHFLDSCWDLVIAHPPCTYLAVSGARWYYHPDDKNLPIEQRRPHPKFPDRAKDREDAVQFFMDVSKIGVNKLAIENPVGIMSSRWRKPDQIIEPWQLVRQLSFSCIPRVPVIGLLLERHWQTPLFSLEHYTCLYYDMPDGKFPHSHTSCK